MRNLILSLLTGAALVGSAVLSGAGAPAPLPAVSAAASTGTIGGTLVDSAGAPVAGAEVFLYQLKDGADTIAATFETVTDAAGWYAFPGMAVGKRWLLDFEHPDFAPMTWPGWGYLYTPGALDLTSGAMPQDLSAVMARPGAISGTIGGLDGAAASVELGVYDYGASAWVASGERVPVGADGRYTLGGLFPGRYQVTVHVGARQQMSPTLEVAEAATATYDLWAGRPAAGSVIRSGTGTTEYLVDGSTLRQLLPGMSADLLPPGAAATTVHPASIVGMTTASGKLGNVVKCSGSFFVVSMGQLWGVSSALVTGLPFTSLSATTCAALPRAATPVKGALILTKPSGTPLYQVASGVRRQLLGKDAVARATATQLASPSAATPLPVSTAFLQTIPTGVGVLPPGSLVSTSGSTKVYLVNGFASLLKVNSAAEAALGGVSPTVLTVTAAELASLKVTGVLQPVQICSGKTYIAGSSKLWPVASSLVSGLPSTSLTASTCAAIAKSSTALTALQVRSSSAPTVYGVAAGQKRVLSAASSAPVLTVSKTFLASLPTIG